MLILKLLRFILPPFHPLKYKWIDFYFVKQDGDGAWGKYTDLFYYDPKAKITKKIKIKK